MLEGYERTGTSLYYEEYVDDDLWLIDEDRNIIAPRESINLAGEKRSQFIPFQINRYQDGIDLAEKYFTIIYNLDDGQADSIPAVNSYFNDEYVVFAWLVDGNVTVKSQAVSIQIQATGLNEKEEDYVYRTHIKVLKVDKSLNSDTIIREHEDLYNGFMNYIAGVLTGETGVVFARVSRILSEFEERISAIAASGIGNTESSELADARVRKNGTSAVCVGDVIREKADNFVIEGNKMYFLSGGVKITEGLEITADLSDYLNKEGVLELLKGYIPVTSNSELVIGIEKAEKGIQVTTRDGETYEVEIETSNAKAFETPEFDEDTRMFHFYDNDGNDVYDPVYIPGGGSGGGPATTSRVVLTNETMVGGKPATTVPVAADKSALLQYRFEDYDSSGEQTGYTGTAEYTVNGKVVLETNISQGSILFESKTYIQQGRNTVRVKVTDEDGNYATKTWTVMSYALSIKDTLNDGDIQTGELLYKYTPTGQLEKTIHFKLDGIEIATAMVTTSGRQQTQAIPAQIHGSHVLEVYATADVNGVIITSNTLMHDIIWIESGNNNPVVASSWSGSVKQYSTAAIPFLVYTPGSLTSSVILAVDGVQVAKRTVERTMQTWSYRPQEAGEKVLTITSGTVVRTINLVVEDAGISINPVVNGRVCDLNPQGHSNDDEDRTWADNGITTTVSEGFDWVNGGFQLDLDGNTCFIVKAGDTLTVNYNLFGDDARKTGKAFNFNFITHNVSNYDAEVLSCMSGGVGLQMNAQNAIMKSEQTTMDVPYCEGKMLEFGLNILPDSEHPEVVVWLNGIPSRTVIYASNDSFSQTEPVPITIGSPDCDVVIYRMQPYTNNLTDDEQMDNFIANGKNADEIIARYERNAICNEFGIIDPDMLEEKYPDLRVLELFCPRFTNGKKDTVTGSTLNHTLVSGGKRHTWVSGLGMEFKGQGTSSEYYGDAARNIEFLFNGGFHFADGSHSPVYAMTDNSIGVNRMVLKVNVASSENANNAIMADEYNTYQPYLRKARQDNPKVRDTMEFHPCVLFVKDESGVLFGDTEMHLYATGDLGNSKSNSEVMGMDPENPNECIVEILNNTADQCRFKSDDLSSENWDGDGNFEFRYEPTNVEEAKTAWQRVLSWVVSTDPLQATNATFPSSITYGGVKYTKDTPEYRRAKFKEEVADYFIVDTLLFHYLFTERHGMVDNRSKNTFVHTIDLIHWDYCFDYDNDTAEGNDNEGGLTLRYGLEDTDQIGTKNVFNAADSVLWCNVRDCLADELKAMYIDRENAGAWDSARILKKYKDYQSLKPERLVVADMRRKYFRPYENNGVTSYLPMMYGTKESQREQYETYQAPYISSKYQGPVSTSDVITLRTYTPTDWKGIQPENKIVLEPYADMYLGLRAGSRTYKVRAKRGQRYEMQFDEIGSLNDTEVYIYSAGRISAIDNLAALYVGYCNFAAGDKLQEIIVGSAVSGYQNTNFTEFSVGNNVLLKKLDLQGCPNLKSAIDLSGCISLQEFYAKKSGITGVVFAPGGLLVKAELPSPANLSLRNLKALTSFSLESYANLKTLRLEDCPVLDSLDFFNKSVALTRARITDIDWTLSDLDVLERLLSMGGLDENEYNTETAVVTGNVKVPEIKSYQLTKYIRAWPNLQIAYDLLIEVYTVTVITPKWTDVQYIERGKDAEDPTKRANNPKPLPVKDSTVSTVFTFSGWDKLFTGVISDRTINAMFAESVRQYTVRWFSNGSLMETKKWDVYSKPTYSGEKPQKDDLPGSFIYYLWNGWDNIPESITQDTDIQAVFVESVLPAAPVDGSLYPFIYSDDPNDSMAYSLGQFYAIIRSGKASEYLAVKDRIKIVLDTDVVKDLCIILNVHSFGHYELADRSGNMSNADFYMDGVLNANRQMNTSNTNVGGWNASKLREWLNGIFYDALPILWKEIIRQSITLASEGNQSATILQSVDYLRVPSDAEVGFNMDAIPYKNEISPRAAEMKFSQYVDNASRIKKQFNGEGTAQNWWLRSADAGGATGFRVVLIGGGSAGTGASASYGVCVGFSV